MIDDGFYPPIKLATEDNVSKLKKRMSLRDWFAGQALAGLNSTLVNYKAEEAYDVADAMMKERKKKKKG